jgi:hypothetical protein
MSESISDLIRILDESKINDELNEAISKLARFGKSAVRNLLDFERSLSPSTRHRLTLAKIFQQMGYPAIRDAIPWIVNEASRINSPGWETALEILEEIGEPAVPEIKKAFLFYSKDHEQYSLEFQGLCTLLERIGSPVMDPLLPELLQLLEAGTDENFVSVYALGPIRKIGSPKANSALRIIGDLILRSRNTQNKLAYINALVDFDPMAVKQLLPILEVCLDDDVVPIRTSADSVLRFLK